MPCKGTIVIVRLKRVTGAGSKAPTNRGGEERNTCENNLWHRGSDVFDVVLVPTCGEKRGRPAYSVAAVRQTEE